MFIKKVSNIEYVWRAQSNPLTFLFNVLIAFSATFSNFFLPHFDRNNLPELSVIDVLNFDIMTLYLIAFDRNTLIFVFLPSLCRCFGIFDGHITA